MMKEHLRMVPSSAHLMQVWRGASPSPSCRYESRPPRPPSCRCSTRWKVAAASRMVNCSTSDLTTSAGSVTSDTCRRAHHLPTSTISEAPPGKWKVVRSHEDFLWLHSVVEENPGYAGLIIPPRSTLHYTTLHYTTLH